jgi:hypothetical protein
MMTHERSIVLAVVRALTWRTERIVTEHGAVTFRDLGVPPLQAYLDGQAFDVAIVVAKRCGS